MTNDETKNGGTKNKKRLYAGALLLEAIVLTVLWLVGRHFSIP